MSRMLPCLVLIAALFASLAAPPAYAGDDAGDDAGKVMDLAFEDAPIGKVLEELARLAGRNVIVAPDVTGQVTIKLAMVDWRKAFELVAAAHGLEVQHKAGDVTVVRKAGGDANSDEHALRKAALKREMDVARVRIAELEREIARAAAAKRPAAEARKVEDVRVMVYAVQDLVQTRKPALLELTKQHARDGTTVQWHGSNLVVRGTEKAHERLAKGLAQLRADVEAVEFVLVEKDGAKRRVRLEQGYTERGPAGNEDATAAARARIENLAQALEHLKKAGARDEAARVAKQLAAAKQRYAEAAARTGHAKAGSGDEGLRAEVRALRGEVRELTALVRKLLELHAAGERRGR